MNKHYMFGHYYGVVTDNEDPDNLGRVKVSLEMLGENIETSWIPVLQFYGGEETGSFFIPEVEDQVVVGFMGDTSDYPIVLGSIYSNSQKPPETEENTASDLNQDGENNLRFIKSRSGNMIIFDDKENEEKIQILASDAKTRFEFLAKDEMLNAETDIDLTIQSKGKVIIDADEIEITASKDITFEADNIKGKSNSKDIEVKSNQNIKLDGSSIKLN